MGRQTSDDSGSIQHFNCHQILCEVAANQRRQNCRIRLQINCTGSVFTVDEHNAVGNQLRWTRQSAGLCRSTKPTAASSICSRVLDSDSQ